MHKGNKKLEQGTNESKMWNKNKRIVEIKHDYKGTRLARRNKLNLNREQNCRLWEQKIWGPWNKYMCTEGTTSRVGNK
jgi:hypothetical protein